MSGCSVNRPRIAGAGHGTALALPARGSARCFPFGRGAFAGADHLPARRQVERAMTVLVPAAAGVLFVFAVVPGAAWLVWAFGWLLFPAVALLARGAVGMAREARPKLQAAARGWGATLRPQDDAAAVANRLRLVAEQLPRPAARSGAVAVAAAADRLAAAASRAADPDLAAWVTERHLRPTLLVMERYARLAGKQPTVDQAALQEFETDGLRAIAAKLDRVQAEIAAHGATAPVVA